MGFIKLALFNKSYKQYKILVLLAPKIIVLFINLWINLKEMFLTLHFLFLLIMNKKIILKEFLGPLHLSIV